MIDNKGIRDEKFSMVKRAESFTHAGRGITIFFKSTHNAWVHAAVLVLAVALGFVFKITSTEWIALILASGLVLVAEAFNTAIEIDINLTSPEYHPYARDTKDVAAGAVLLATLTAGIIGAFIFLPHIFTTRLSNTENRPETLTYTEPSGAFSFTYNPLFL
ncbi:MAG: diacylglycerol kinase family protein [Patescibacteria group bacterium]